MRASSPITAKTSVLISSLKSFPNMKLYRTHSLTHRSEITRPPIEQNFKSLLISTRDWKYNWIGIEKYTQFLMFSMRCISKIIWQREWWSVFFPYPLSFGRESQPKPRKKKQKTGKFFFSDGQNQSN
jgi:hypothetical protein